MLDPWRIRQCCDALARRSELPGEITPAYFSKQKFKPPRQAAIDAARPVFG